MKKSWVLMGLALSALLVCACFEPKPAPYRKIPPCQADQSATASETLMAIYKSVDAKSCLAYLPPYDMAGWFESRMNSRRVRGEASIRVGCIHCPQGNRDCKSPNNCTGCTTASFYFDFTRIPENAEIIAAKLAVHVSNNQEILPQSILEGRLNVGEDFAVVAKAPTVNGNWALYDVTPFACRAAIERRTSVCLDLSMSCGSGPTASVATMALDPERGPRMILEYR